jgi:hypothetical protein
VAAFTARTNLSLHGVLSLNILCCANPEICSAEKHSWQAYTEWFRHLLFGGGNSGLRQSTHAKKPCAALSMWSGWQRIFSGISASVMLAFLYETNRGPTQIYVLDCAAHRNRNGIYSFVGPKIAVCASISSDVAVGTNCCQSALVLFPCTTSLQICKEPPECCVNIFLPDFPQSDLH